MFEKVKKAINPYKDPSQKYDKASNFYHLIMGVWEIKANKEAIAMADIKPDEIFLDLAAGTGWFLRDCSKEEKA